MIKKADKICVRRQCTLLSLNRSGLDYEPVGPSQDDLDVMREIDKEYTRHPFYGSRKMVIALAKAGHRVNRKRVQRLMRLMGIEAIAPGPNTSNPPAQEIEIQRLRHERRARAAGQLDHAVVRMGADHHRAALSGDALVGKYA